MVRDAEKFQEEDKKRKEAAEARNEADSLIYNARKTVGELKDKVEASDVEAVETAIKEAEGALESDDTEAIKSASQKLSEALQTLGAKVYEQQAQAQEQEQEGSAGAEGSEEDVVDSDDYEVS